MLILRELNTFYHSSLTMVDIEAMADVDVRELQQTARLIREKAKEQANDATE